MTPPYREIHINEKIISTLTRFFKPVVASDIEPTNN